MSPFSSVDARLIERGYSFVPIAPGTKSPGHIFGGKWRNMPGWTRYARDLPSRWALSVWQTYPDAGIGLVAGPAGGHVVAVDIDTDDPVIRAAIMSAIPPTTVSKRGQKGDTRFFRAPNIDKSKSWNLPTPDGEVDENGKRKTYRVCDLIGPGRQTLLPPTIHPDTKEPYVWTGPDALEDMDPAELPELTPAHIEAISAALVGLGYEAEPERAPLLTSGMGGDNYDVPIHRRLNNAALENLTAWVPKLRLARCRRSAQGYEAVATWRASNTGQAVERRKLNLKISRRGIVDFGDGPRNYTALDLWMAASDCNLDTAFGGLSDALGWNDNPIIDLPLTAPAKERGVGPVRSSPHASNSNLRIEMTAAQKIDFDLERKARAITAQAFAGEMIILRDGKTGGQIDPINTKNVHKVRPALRDSPGLTAWIKFKDKPGEYQCPGFDAPAERAEEPAPTPTPTPASGPTPAPVEAKVTAIKPKVAATANIEAQDGDGGGDDAAHPPSSAVCDTKTGGSRRPSLVMIRASDVQPQKIQWLWPNRFAVGKLSLIAGNPGLGKSQLTIHMAAQITTGGKWPNGEGPAPHGSVVILSSEDDPADTLVPRLMAAGADVSRVHIVEAIKVPMGTGSLERQFNLADDVQALCDAIDQIGDVKLVIIDPITAYLGTGKSVDSHNNSDVRAALLPLQARAAKLGFAAVAVSHLNKGGGTEALMRIMGSLAFVAAARVVFLVVGDKDTERALFIPMKNNIGVKRPGLAFRVVSKTIADDIETSAIEWDADEVTTTADEALAAAAGREGEKDTGQSSVPEAMNFLRDVLTDGPVSAKEVQHRAKEAGITKATLRRAQKALDIKARHRGDGGASGKGEWIWEMPEQIKLRRTDIDD